MQSQRHGDYTAYSCSICKALSFLETHKTFFRLMRKVLNLDFKFLTEQHNVTFLMNKSIELWSSKWKLNNIKFF